MEEKTPAPLDDIPTMLISPDALTFEAAVIREAALACRFASDHNCRIEVHIGGRWRKRPVDITISPGPAWVAPSPEPQTPPTSAG
jgi:hypothetical protein